MEIGWDQATRAEARDFLCWVQLADKPERPHWRYPGGRAPGMTMAVAPGTPNPVTGKRSPGRGYAMATVAHCESVLRTFYDFHLEASTGPMVNPFPLARGRRGRANAHRNPMQPAAAQRAGRYRPKMARRIPRQIPDEMFDQLFARLGSHRDRALVAFWVSTGARASELLGAAAGDVDPGQQLVTVIRKGTRTLQQLPASPDAFVWLRLYQAQLDGLVPAGRDQPLWWTLRRPFRALTYDAARAMFTRANAAMGANWTLHDLRHSAAYRMARDPAVPLADLQWVMGHACLSTTQRYLNQPSGIASRRCWRSTPGSANVARDRRRQRGIAPRALRRCSARTRSDPRWPARRDWHGGRPACRWHHAAGGRRQRGTAGPLPAAGGCLVVRRPWPPGRR